MTWYTGEIQSLKVLRSSEQTDNKIARSERQFLSQPRQALEGLQNYSCSILDIQHCNCSDCRSIYALYKGHTHCDFFLHKFDIYDLELIQIWFSEIGRQIISHLSAIISLVFIHLFMEDISEDIFYLMHFTHPQQSTLLHFANFFLLLRESATVHGRGHAKYSN